jgi:hypothetical protein
MFFLNVTVRKKQTNNSFLILCGKIGQKIDKISSWNPERKRLFEREDNIKIDLK